jgi:hypothetical protein
MRRVLASLLVALFSFSLIAPALFASDADSKLPACCRRNGKHHCTMASGQESSGPSLHAARCADFPSASALPATPIAGFPGTADAAHIGLATHLAMIAHTESRSQISYSQAGQKRGPPSLFS